MAESPPEVPEVEPQAQLPLQLELAVAEIAVAPVRHAARPEEVHERRLAAKHPPRFRAV